MSVAASSAVKGELNATLKHCTKQVWLRGLITQAMYCKGRTAAWSSPAQPQLTQCLSSLFAAPDSTIPICNSTVFECRYVYWAIKQGLLRFTLRSSAAAADFDKPGYLYSCTTSAGSCNMLAVVCLLAGACSAWPKAMSACSVCSLQQLWSPAGMKLQQWVWEAVPSFCSSCRLQQVKKAWSK